MNFNELTPNSLRKTADIAAVHILEHPEKFPLLFDGVTKHGDKLALRISRVIYRVFELNPELVKPHIRTVYDILLSTKNGSVIRNFLSIMQHAHVYLNEEEVSMLLDFCFKQLEDPKAEIAHEVMALETLYNISNVYPELKAELKPLIEIRYEESSPAFQSRCRKIMKKLNKEVFE